MFGRRRTIERNVQGVLDRLDLGLPPWGKVAVAICRVNVAMVKANPAQPLNLHGNSWTAVVTNSHLVLIATSQWGIAFALNEAGFAPQDQFGAIVAVRGNLFHLHAYSSDEFGKLLRAYQAMGGRL